MQSAFPEEQAPLITVKLWSLAWSERGTRLERETARADFLARFG